MAKEELKIVSVKRSEPDLRKIGRVALIAVGELAPTKVPKRVRKSPPS